MSGWDDEEVNEYFSNNYRDKGIVLILSDYYYAALPAGMDKWVYVDIENNRASAHDTLRDVIKEHYGEEFTTVKILRCGPESSCAKEWNADGCDVLLIDRHGGKEIRGVCTVY